MGWDEARGGGTASRPLNSPVPGIEGSAMNITRRTSEPGTAFTAITGARPCPDRSAPHRAGQPSEADQSRSQRYQRLAGQAQTTAAANRARLQSVAIRNERRSSPDA